MIGVDDAETLERLRKLRKQVINPAVAEHRTGGQNGDGPAPRGAEPVRTAGVRWCGSVAVEVARRGITVNAVAPGWIDTDMTAEVSRDLLNAVPARRAGTAEDVANAVRFLVSDKASYVTGEFINVTGGAR